MAIPLAMPAATTNPTPNVLLVLDLGNGPLRSFHGCWCWRCWQVASSVPRVLSDLAKLTLQAPWLLPAPRQSDSPRPSIAALITRSPLRSLTFR